MPFLKALNSSHFCFNSHLKDLSSVTESLSLELPGCPPDLPRAQALGLS